MISYFQVKINCINISNNNKKKIILKIFFLSKNVIIKRSDLIDKFLINLFWDYIKTWISKWIFSFVKIFNNKYHKNYWHFNQWAIFCPIRLISSILSSIYRNFNCNTYKIIKKFFLKWYFYLYFTILIIHNIIKNSY